MIVKKILFIIFALVTSFFYAQAGLASLSKLEFKQTDGSTFQGYKRGDEWFNWVQSEHGVIVLLNYKSMNYEVAKIEKVNGELQLLSTGKIYKTEDNASGYLKNTLRSKFDLQNIWKREIKKVRVGMGEE